MAPTASPHKRRVVKHRTNAAEAGGRAAHHATGGTRGGRSGFQVGPKHAPDGSYLGRAKKIKSRLIENAKVKKAFYRGAGASASGSGSGAPPLISDAEQIASRDEGRFAPEDPVARAALSGVDEVLRVREQKRARGTAAGESAAASTSAAGGSGDDDGAEVQGKRRRVERQKFAPPPPRSKGKQREERPAAAAASSDKPQRTREQAEQERRQREKKAMKTNRRGQPDLGARMELLLEKIKR